MSKQRATGAQVPFPYTHTRQIKHKDGTTTTKRTQRWQVQLELPPDVAGRRRRKTITGKTSAECARKLREARAKLNAGESTATRRKRITLRYYAQLFLEAAEHRVAPSTWQSYKTRLKKCGGWLDRDITAYKPSDVRRMLDACASGLSTKHSLWCVLNQTFDMALEDEVINSNPCRLVKLRGMRHIDTGRRAYSVPEIKSMLAETLNMQLETAARMWWRIFTGMRQSEICGATIEDLHLDEQFYTLRWQIAEIPCKHGCGEPDTRGHYPCGMKRGGNCPDAEWQVPDGFAMRHLTGRWCLKRPKSGKTRIVPLTDELAEVIQRYLTYTADWPNPYGLLFRRPNGEPITTQQDTREFKALLVACGMDPTERHGHETRYSAVTLMRRAGADLKTVEEIIGHTSTAVDNIYRTVEMEEKRQTVGLISQALHVGENLLPGTK